MLNTVEEIEEEILKYLVAYDDKFESMHERMDAITQQGTDMLDELEEELDKKYADYAGDDYEELYLSEFKEGKQKVLESVSNLINKEASDTLSVIQVN
jgi:GTP-binding protein EngB required for normal cell division